MDLTKVSNSFLLEHLETLMRNVNEANSLIEAIRKELGSRINGEEV